MTSTPPRRFTMADAMILVGATAIGMGGARGYLTALDDPPYDLARFAGRAHWVVAHLVALFPLLIAYAFGLVFCRLRQPRPGLMKLMRQPGFEAIVLISAIASIKFLMHFAALAFRYTSGSTATGLRAGMEYLWLWGLYDLGLFTAVSWGMRAISQGWHPEPCWIDRAGRTIGCLWIAIYTSVSLIQFSI